MKEIAKTGKLADEMQRNVTIILNGYLLCFLQLAIQYFCKLFRCGIQFVRFAIKRPPLLIFFPFKLLLAGTGQINAFSICFWLFSLTIIAIYRKYLEPFYLSLLL